MPAIYIVLSHTGTWLSRLIRWLKGSKYTHVSLAFDPNLKQLYSFGRLRPSNPFKAGFVIESIHSDFYKRFHNTDCQVIRIQTSEVNYQRLKERIDYFVAHQQVFKYNILGLITFLFRYSLNRPTKFFCSQFVATVLSESKILTFNKKMGLIKPMDFTQVEGAVSIYEGKLLDYQAS